MGVRLFNRDDDAYLKWLGDHRGGYVLNARRSPTASYLFLHRSTCHQISSPTRTNWTTNQYVKFCAESSADLVTWAIAHVPEASPRSVRRCRRCAPSIA